MKHDFPHISDTTFPDISTVNVYKHENVFDYEQYTDSVKLKMMNVSWCGDYDNAVYFESVAARDEWFDNASGLVLELSTMFRLYADGEIKVDVPIDEAMLYNYLYVDYGKLPNKQLTYPYSKMFYFIDSMKQESVNTTTLYLKVDYWTTFINYMRITYVNLERGHLPMHGTDVGTYLANPVENNDGLLTPDVNYGELSRVANTTPVVINNENATMYLCFATNGDYKTANWGNTVKTSNYYNEQAISAVQTFAIPLSTYSTFKTNVDRDCPQFWQTVKAMFIAPNTVLKFGASYTFNGVTCTELKTNGDKTIHTFDITKDKFGYPSNIDDITKLYSYPYAAIEVTDMKGLNSLIKIEDTCGSLEFHTIMNDMYPFINIEGYLNGIGTASTAAIAFKNSYNNTFNIGGRFYDFTTKWSFPVFAVQLTAEQNWDLNGKIEAAANNTNSKAMADNVYTNAIANAAANKAISDATAELSNTIANANATTAKSNADASADTAKTNADASADTAKTNAAASATTAKANSISSALVSNTNTKASNAASTTCTALQTAANLVMVTNSNTTASTDTEWGNALALALTNWSAGYTWDMAAANIDAAVGTAAAGLVTGGLSTLSNAIAASATSSNPVSGTVAAVNTIVQGACSGINTIANTGISINLEQTKADLAVDYAYATLGETNQNNTDRLSLQTGIATTNTTKQNETDIAKTAAMVTASNANADRSYALIANETDGTAILNYNTATGNASRTQTTAKANATRTQTVTKANAQRSYDNTVTNASDTLDVQLANNETSYDTAEANATRTKNTSYANTDRTFNAAKNQTLISNPPEYGQLTGTPDAVNKPIGIVYNVITQSDNAIKLAAEQFLRYGYMLNRQVEVASFNVMPKFTYWKCSAVYCNDLGVYEGAQKMVKSILENGVTVWRNPNDIGLTSIYDNKEQ